MTTALLPILAMFAAVLALYVIGRLTIELALVVIRTVTR